MPSNKPDNPMDRRIAIMELFDSGRFFGTCSVDEMVKRVGSNSPSITRAFTALGFTIARRRSSRRVKTKIINIPRQYKRPDEWPIMFVKQRQLRKDGASVGFAKTIFHSADVPLEIFDQAVGMLIADGIPITRRGALKRAINDAMKKRDENYKRNFIPAADLAAKLRESPDMPAEALKNISGMYRKAAVRGANR